MKNKYIKDSKKVFNKDGDLNCLQRFKKDF